MDVLIGALDGYARAIVGFSNDKLVGAAYDARPHAHWPLMRLPEALLALSLYLAWLCYGLCRRPAVVDKAAAGERSLVTWSKLLSDPSLHLAPVLRDPLLVLQVLYNGVQVCLSLYMASAAVYAAVAVKRYGLLCNPFDPSDVDITFVVWLFYVSKCFDFVDTIFIVVRGKWDQFSFLHTYHHASIFATYWWVSSAAYTGDLWVPVTFNSAVHLAMYFYFFSRSLGIAPWWGIYLTQFQMAQFVFMMLHGAAMIAFDCPYPRTVTVIYVVYIALMLALFAQFYVRKYCFKKAGGGADATAPRESGSAVFSGREAADARSSDDAAAVRDSEGESTSGGGSNKGSKAKKAASPGRKASGKRD